jgi:hypothetical protein
MGKEQAMKTLDEVAKALRIEYLAYYVEKHGWPPDDRKPHSRTTTWEELPIERKVKWLRLAAEAQRILGEPEEADEASTV